MVLALRGDADQPKKRKSFAVMDMKGAVASGGEKADDLVDAETREHLFHRRFCRYPARLAVILCVECDGAMYYRFQNGKELDIYRQAFLESLDWTILSASRS